MMRTCKIFSFNDFRFYRANLINIVIGHKTGIRRQVKVPFSQNHPYSTVSLKSSAIFTISDYNYLIDEDNFNFILGFNDIVLR